MVRPEFFYYSFYRPSRPNFLKIKKEIKDIFLNFIFIFPSDSCQYSTEVQFCFYHFFSHTLVEKIEKSINLLPVCKLYPTLLAPYPTLLARLLMKDKKSTRLNSNISSQSNRFMVLQAKLLPCYDSGKPEFKAGKRFKYCGNIKFLTSFSYVLVHLTSLLV